jgi:hypothetical protein
VGGGILMRPPVRYSELVSVFIEESTSKVRLDTLKMQKNLKTIGAYTESTDFIYKAYKRIVHLVTLSLKANTSNHNFGFSGIVWTQIKISDQ